MKLKEAPWKESYNKPRHTDIIKKQTHHFTNKGPYSQNYGFSSSHVQMWELNHKEGWAQKNWYFWTVVLENSWVPWTASSNQSILKEINSEYSLEGLMLKLQYFGHLMRRANSLKKTLLLRKIEGSRSRGQQRMRCLDVITNSVLMNWTNSGRQWRMVKPGVLQSMGSQRVRHDLVTEQQQQQYFKSNQKNRW